MIKKMSDKDRRELIFKIFLHIKDGLKKIFSFIKTFSQILYSLTSLTFLLIFTYFIGFSHTVTELEKLTNAFRAILLILFISRLIVGLISFERKRYLSLSLRTGILIFSFFVLFANSGIVDRTAPLWHLFSGNGPVIVACLILSALEFSRVFQLVSSANIPPALVFSSSFLIIILIGSGLLMLPNSRTETYGYLNALFTSVSAVCVTGLTVVSTAGSFTLMGKIIILCLIQVGGLGIMTFTGFFSYIFTSRATLQERMLLQDMFSSESLGNLFKILIQIILFTFLAEGVGALVIYFSLSDEISGRAFFSIFHSVSAFCNAGFSTVPHGLMEPLVNRNHLLLSSIMVLIIIGGLGFPVIVKLYYLTKSKIRVFYGFLRGRNSQSKREWLDAGSKIVIRATILLLLSGALIYYFVERNNSMKNMVTGEQFFLSFFNSVTARTAGFNMSNLTSIGYPAIFMIIFLMWIGASPGSTGGGIKTSAFAIAVRSAWSNIRGRKALEISGREINPGTINRVLSIIILSIIVIGTGFFCLLIFEPGKNPVYLLFETVSAFSTVGLSLADTSTLSQGGKLIVIVLMFVGRVGPLTLLTGLFFSGRKKYYSLPGGDIAIN